MEQNQIHDETQQPQAPPPGEYPDVTATPPPAPRSSLSDLLNLVMDAGPRADYARQIVEAELERESFGQDIKLAAIFAQCGAFDDIKGANAKQSIALAMAKIQLGRSWGLSPADAMRYVYFTNGKPALETAIISAKMRESGYDWDIQWYEDASTKKCIGCTLWPKKWSEDRKECKPLTDRDGNPVSVSFTKKDADTAMVWEKGKQIPLSEKWNFRAWPRDMYFARCISRVHKWHASDVMRGAHSREEMEDVTTSVRDDGDLSGIREGTRADQERIAEQKIAELERQRAAKGCAPGETPEDRNARIERQIAEQTEAARQIAEQEKAQEQQPAGELSDEENRKLDDEIAREAEGKAQSKVDVPVTQRARPVFGRRN